MIAVLDALPKVRGTYTENAPLKDLVWFRAGGAADILFRPADVDDLCAFMAGKPADLPVSVIGVGSNLLIRDGGIPGVVIRLPSVFGRIEPVGDARLKAGAAALDAAVARAAADAGIEGMEFLRGIPGTIGGALTMNAGCYGRELKDIFVEAHAVDSRGRLVTFAPSDMGFTYRHSRPEGIVYVDVLLKGTPGDAEMIRARNERARRAAREHPAGEGQNRRLHLHQSAGAQGLATDRRSGLPRPRERRRAGFGEALQFPDQHRQCHGRRYRRSGRGRARACESKVGRSARMGNQAGRAAEMTKYKRIAVLLGGRSPERDVSSCPAVPAPRRCGRRLRVQEFDAGKDLGERLHAFKPDAAFNALHGRWGEDGCVQGLLELMEIPYTHSGVLASAIAMHKERAKAVFHAAGLPLAKSILVDRRIAGESHAMKPPYVIKPVNQGSSVGVYIVRPGDNRPPEELRSAEWSLGDEVMIEDYVPGRELTVAVMGSKPNGLGALAVTEIVPRTEFYDYDAKYAPGGSDHVIPAKLSPAVTDECMRLAERATRRSAAAACRAPISATTTRRGRAVSSCSR